VSVCVHLLACRGSLSVDAASRNAALQQENHYDHEFDPIRDAKLSSRSRQRGTEWESIAKSPAGCRQPSAPATALTAAHPAAFQPDRLSFPAKALGTGLFG